MVVIWCQRIRLHLTLLKNYFYLIKSNDIRTTFLAQLLGQPCCSLLIFVREMIFVQPLCDNFCNNFLSHTHIMFLLSLSIVLVSVPIPTFL